MTQEGEHQLRPKYTSRLTFSSLSKRRIAGCFFLLAGLAMLGSGAVINPWVGRFWRNKPMIDVYDVMLGYFLWSLVLGTSNVVVGLTVTRKRWRTLDRLAFSWLLVSVFLLTDRLLLAKCGLPLWIADRQIHFRHRPGVTRSWWGTHDPNWVIRINRYGHHDDDFPLHKAPDEFRGLILGDSITMGHGLVADQTFSNQLEKLLVRHGRNYNRYQIINAGVMGYSIFQELVILRESLVFEPNFIAVGFCMNDVTEPFVVNRDLGGTGTGFHGIMQVRSSLGGYLVNETGFGRLLRKWRKRKADLRELKRREIYNMRHMAAQSETDPRMKEAWDVVLSDLEGIYTIAENNQIPVVLLIFPHTFQLIDETFQVPQRILKRHASKHNVDVLDFTQVFRDLIYDDEIVAYLLSKNMSPQDITRLFQHGAAAFFMDEDHYTPLGHAIVAQKIGEYLVEKKLIEAGPAREQDEEK